VDFNCRYNPRLPSTMATAFDNKTWRENNVRKEVRRILVFIRSWSLF
jgi:hypothetical protein